MDKESQTCGSCSKAYHTTDRIPRILNCAHTLCSLCLNKIINTPDLRKCPFDGFVFNKAQKSLENFPPNFALLTLLEGKRHNKCQVHGSKLNKFCFQDKVKICSDCASFGEHKGHPVKKIKELKAKGINAKKELEEGLSKFDKNPSAQDVERLKNRYLGQVASKVGEINKILKVKHSEWRKQVESLFERNQNRSLLKEEASKVIEEIDQAFQNEENLTILDQDFNSIISRLQPQVSTEEVSRLGEETSRMISSLESFLANQAKLLKNFDLPHEKGKPEELMIEEAPEKKQQEEPQQVPPENSTKTKQELKLLKSVLTFGIFLGALKIWVRNGELINQIIDLDKFGKMKGVNIVFEQYDSLFQDSNDLDSLPRILDQLNNCTSLVIDFLPPGLTDDRALCLLKLLFPRIQHLTEISISFERCNIANQPISFFCAEILPKATSLKSFTLNLHSARINDLSLSPFHKSLETFKFEAFDTDITDDCIEKMFQSVEGVKELDLSLQRTPITDRSLKVLGNTVMPCMKNLEKFSLDVSETQITMEGLSAIFTGIPHNIKGLVLNLGKINLPDEVISLFEEKVCPKLELVEDVSFWLAGKDLNDKMSKILGEIRKEAGKRRKTLD